MTATVVRDPLSSVMGARDYAAVFRSRWLSIVATTIVIVGAAITISLATTPMYRAEARLFVETPSASSSGFYESSLASQQRVESYIRLLTGTALSRRTLDALHLDMTPAELASKITVTSRSGSVLLAVSVRDASAAQARDIANGLSDQFTELVAEVETPRGGGPPNSMASVVDRAELPVAPVEPRTLRNLLAGTLIGVLAGLGVAIMRHRLDSTVRNREVLEVAARSSVLGIVPFDPGLMGGPSADGTAPRNVVSEPFRRLSVNLKFADVDHPHRILLVTSSVPGEGKTTVSLNLAYALAEEGHRVVLVEGDLRRPRLGGLLGTSGAVGITSVLAGEVTVSEAVQRTQRTNLWFAASGPLRPNPNGLLGSAAARNLLDQLRGAFDYVVIDSPPLLPVSDGVLLATMAEGVLLVARHGLAKRGEVARAAAKIEHVGAQLLGLIVAAVPAGSRDLQLPNEYWVADFDR